MGYKVIGAIIALIGVILIYDGRRIVKKYFAFGDENIGTYGMKLFGGICAIIGGIICLL